MTQVVGKGVVLVDLDRTGFDRGLVGLQASSKSKFAAIGKTAALGLAAVGVAAAVAGTKAVKLEADFSRTMNQVAAVTDAPKREMRALGDLAIKMGRDTVFSAGDASKAILELAKGGLEPATIRAGALKASMDLAAAGGLDMATAANTTVRAMGAFGLSGKQAAQVANALAGAANSSSADVSELSQALGAGGLAAKTAGFSIQETTAVLAAFADQGLRGQDAGTSLKTMLTRLVPVTNKQKEAFRELGIITEDGRNRLIKANGEFKSATEIAGILNNATKDLTESEQVRLLALAFGSDAQRAATALAAEGAAGLRDYLKATKDQTAAQKLGEAAMKGTAGALEQLKGSFETFLLQVGILIRPVVIDGLKSVTGLLNDITGALANLKSGGASGALGEVADVTRRLSDVARKFVRETWPSVKDAFTFMGETLEPHLKDLGRTIRDELVPAFEEFAPILVPVAKALIALTAAGVITGLVALTEALEGLARGTAGVMNGIRGIKELDPATVFRGLNQVLTAMPGSIGNVVGLLVQRLPERIKEGGRSLIDAWNAVWGSLGRALTPIFDGIIGSVGKSWQGITTITSRAMGPIRMVVTQAWGVIRNSTTAVFGGIRDYLRNLWEVVRNIFRVATTAVRTTVGVAWTAVRNNTQGVFNGIRDYLRNIWNAIRDVVRVAVEAVRDRITQTWQTTSQRTRDVWNALRDFLRTNWNTIRDFTSTAMTAVRERVVAGWDTIRDRTRTIWEGVRDFLRNLITNTLPNAFRNGIDAIGRIWDRLREAARRPVAFVVNTVYNNGIRRVVNLIPGVPNLPAVNFAEGGVLPGFSPGRDIHSFTSPTGGRLELSGGEAIMRPEFTRAVGGERGVKALNRMARLGKFFLGGVVPTIASQITRHSGYSWASWAGDLNDPGSGDLGDPVRAWADGIVKSVQRLTTSYGTHIRIDHPQSGNQTLYAHLSGVSVRPGQRVSAGQRIGAVGSTGNSSGPHLHFEIAGGSPGSSGGGFIGTITDFVKNLLGGDIASRLPFGSWVSSLRGMGEWGVMMGQMVGSMAGSVKSWVMDKVRSLFQAAQFSAGDAPLPNLNVGSATVRATVKAIASQFGWGSGSQWNALSNLITHESGWNVNAQNPNSSAYGLFQFLDSTWASTGIPKTSNAQLQTTAGLRYIRDRYGSPSQAWAFWNRNHWYDQGGMLQSGSFGFNGSGRPERVLDPSTTRNFETLTAALDQLVAAPRLAANATSAAAQAAGLGADGGGRGHGGDEDLLRELRGLRRDIRALPREYKVGERKGSR